MAQAAAAGRLQRSEGPAWMVGVDVGGTFTDAIAIAEDGSLRTAKVASTPADPSAGFEQALRELSAAGAAPGQVRLLGHGTTVATNALITGRLARVVLVTTEGFRDILAIRGGRRPSVYDLDPAKPRDLVARRDRVEVAERIGPHGEVLRELTPGEIARVCREVAGRRPDAVAIGLLFSYLDGRHEQALAAALRRSLPDVPVTLSSEVAREFREYPRIATTAINAGLRPVVGQYVLRAEARARKLGLRAPLLVMQSNGGYVPSSRADAEAHRLLLSGPAAAVTGTLALGARYGIGRLISLDMGGTSLDVCLVRDGVIPVARVQSVDHHPVLCSAVEIVTAGAAGGSIAYTDQTGRLHVGPESSGARPGPAAYGHGGQAATVTDAHVATGILPADLGLADGLKLDADAARDAVRRLADALTMAEDDAALGIIAITCAHVTATIRSLSVERGIDPRDHTLVAFGGAGPMYAGLVLRELKLGRALIPAFPGLFAAAGLVAADLRIDESQTVLRRHEPAAVQELRGWFDATARRLRAQLRADGVPGSRIRVMGSLDCRFPGQGFDLPVPIPYLSRSALDAAAARFRDLHERTYGYADPAEPVEIVTARLSVFGSLASPEPSRVASGSRTPARAALLGKTPARLPGGCWRADVPVYQRDLLRAGNRLPGPAIIHQMDATTVVLEGQAADMDELGSLWLSERAHR
jgi:N-methylhydantoinase A